MKLFELSRTFVAVKYTKISFVFLLILLSCVFGFYFFSQSTYATIGQFKPKSITTENKWFSLEINNNFGIEGNGFSKDRAEKLIAGSQDFIKDWLITLDNGKYSIELLGQSHEIFPQLYFNDAPRLLNVALHQGKLPQKNGQEVLVSYDFWRKKLASNPAAIGDYIEVDGAKFLVSGVTEEGFDSFFLGQKYDVFVDAQQWISSQSQNPMFFQVILMARPINLAIAPLDHLSHQQILSKIQIVADNLNITDDSSLLLFEGLVDDIKGMQSLVDFSTFYYYLAFAVLLLAVLAFVLYQGMSILKQQNELYTRNVLGEGELYLMLNQVLYVCFWLMMAMLLGALVFSISLFVFKESSLFSFLQIKLNARVMLLSIANITFFIAMASSVLGCFALVVFKQNRILVKKLFFLTISLSMLIMVGLSTVTWINKVTLDKKFTDKIQFQTDGIYQWFYSSTGLGTLNDTNDGSQKALETVLLDNLASIAGVKGVLVSGVTPINGFNSVGYQKVEEDGSFTLKNDYFANVSEDYFDFFEIPVISGNISEEVSQSDVVINETLAKQYGGVEKAIGNKTESGENIIAVVKDAHFLSSEMVVPPFSYYIKNKFQNMIISIKGDFNVSYVNEVVERVMQEYHGHLELESWGSFNTEFKKYFTQDFNRLRLLSLLSLTIFVIGLISVYSGTLQWIAINRKEIAIKFALGMTENKMCQGLVLKTILWLLMVGVFSGLLLYLMFPVLGMPIELTTMLSVIGSILAVLAFSITVIYWIVLNQLNKDFLAQVL